MRTAPRAFRDHSPSEYTFRESRFFRMLPVFRFVLHALSSTFASRFRPKSLPTFCRFDDFSNVCVAFRALCKHSRLTPLLCVYDGRILGLFVSSLDRRPRSLRRLLQALSYRASTCDHSAIPPEPDIRSAPYPKSSVFTVHTAPLQCTAIVQGGRACRASTGALLCSA